MKNPLFLIKDIFEKEVGTCKGRIGRNVWEQKRIKQSHIDDSYEFSNAIRLILFLIAKGVVKGEKI